MPINESSLPIHNTAMVTQTQTHTHTSLYKKRPSPIHKIGCNISQSFRHRHYLRQ